MISLDTWPEAYLNAVADKVSRKAGGKTVSWMVIVQDLETFIRVDIKHPERGLLRTHKKLYA